MWARHVCTWARWAICVLKRKNWFNLFNDYELSENFCDGFCLLKKTGSCDSEIVTKFLMWRFATFMLYLFIDFANNMHSKYLLRACY